jgi:hypothetical protein
MTLRTGHIHVRAGKRERCVVVIERSLSPRGSVMTCGARRWKTRAHVIGIRSPGVIRRMAGVAVRGHRRVVVVRMALCTRHVDVRTGKGKRPC